MDERGGRRRSSATEGRLYGLRVQSPLFCLQEQWRDYRRHDSESGDVRRPGILCERAVGIAMREQSCPTPTGKKNMKTILNAMLAAVGMICISQAPASEQG